MRQPLDPGAWPGGDDAADERAAAGDAVEGRRRPEIDGDGVHAVQLGGGQRVQHAVRADAGRFLDIETNRQRAAVLDQPSRVVDQARLATESASEAARHDRLHRRYHGSDHTSDGRVHRLPGHQIAEQVR